MKVYKYIMVLFLLSACTTKHNITEERKTSLPDNIVTLTNAEIQTAGIAFDKPEKGTAKYFLKVSGVIDVPPQNIVSISFPIGGYLLSTRLLPGMKVYRGQSIATMQDQSIIQLQQDYLVAKSKVGFLQKEYERQKLLNTTKAASDKTVEQTQSEYETQKILMNSYKEKLRMIGINPASLNENNIHRSVLIHSPIDGYVSAVHVNIGKYVNPSDVLFELVNPRDVHLAVKVFEKDLPSIHAGQKLKVNLVNNPDKYYDAEVKLVSRNLDNDRSATVHCHFLTSSDDLLPGMFANAIIETKNNEAITVPEDAVVRWGNQQYIFVQGDRGQFEMTEVKIGSTADGKSEIQSPQNDLLAKTVISKNAYAALMKMRNKAE
jgi:membrane fusion protein, heavy metal efflux system